MVKVLKILAVIVALLLLALGSMFFGLVKPPEVLKDIPYFNKFFAASDKSETATTPQLTESDQLRIELEDTKTAITFLENENAELRQRLTEVEKERNSLRALNDEQKARTDQLKKLAEYYSSMKVKQAAAIMAELDDEIIIGILTNMGSETAAEIIGELDPVEAAVLTKKMLQEEGGE